jgi:hypothetical protein
LSFAQVFSDASAATKHSFDQHFTSSEENIDDQQFARYACNAERRHPRGLGVRSNGSAWHFGGARQQTGFDPAQELEDQQAAAAQARQQSQQAQQTAAQQVASTQGQGVGGAARGAAGGAVIGAIAGDAGKGAAIGSAVGLLAGWHRRRAEEIEAQNQQLQAQQQIAAQSAQRLAVSQQKLGNYNLAFKTCMQGRGYTLN